MLTPGEAARRVEASEIATEIAVEGVESRPTFLQWGPIIAGSLVAAALSLVLIAFGSAIGLGVLSSSPTWRDDFAGTDGRLRDLSIVDSTCQFWSRRLCGGALRERWHPTAHANVVEFRDGVHGVVSWAIAAVVSGLVIAASVAGVVSKAVGPTTSPAATAGEPLIAYELDRFIPRRAASTGGRFELQPRGGWAHPACRHRPARNFD